MLRRRPGGGGAGAEGAGAAVIRTVPVGFQSRGVSGRTAASRRPKTAPGRTASWSSPSGSARTAASRSAVRASTASGRSTVPPQRRGCSSAVTRPSPWTAAWSGAATVSAGETAAAPRVRHHRGASVPASPSAWTRVAVRAAPTGTPPARAPVPSPGSPATASSETTPVNGPSASSRARRAAARPARSWPATSRSWAPVPSAVRTAVVHGWPAWSAGTTASQVPAGVPAVARFRGRQAMRWRQPSTVAWSPCLRRQSRRAGRTRSNASPSTPSCPARESNSSSWTAAQKAASPASGAGASAAGASSGQNRSRRNG
ncbi:Uncharacterised protein [Streptomyces griseus]|uniref:Uncharacterized protein n=1 Tax=Streptomyces griseus TaxID=1911 RepID=A0A380N755_STRGR|nr:Uncharacterised protein [Streptomyces griseus]